MMTRREATTMRLALGTTFGLALACAVLGASALVGPPPAAAAVKPAATFATSSPTPAPATPSWALLPGPSSATGPGCIATFGDAGVAVVGTGETIAISTDGGATWAQRTLPDWPVQSVAFSDSAHGYAVGPPNNFDETSDGGSTWQSVPSLPTLNPADTFQAVAAARSRALVSVLGLQSVLTSTDGGTTWAQEATSGIASYPSAPLSIVAGPSGFDAAAGGNDAFLTRDATGTWTAQAAPSSDPVVALALAGAPVWGNGTPDLFAITATGVSGSDDAGATFTTLPAPPGSTQVSAALFGAPQPELLVGGSSGLLERYVPSSSDWVTGAWASDTGPLTGQIVSCATGPGSVAYALSASGRVERTLSSGAAPFSLSASKAGVTATGDVGLTAASSIRAPGRLVLEEQPAGGKWQTLVPSWLWSTSPTTPGDVIDEPLSTTQYRLRFVFAGHTAATSATVTVGVRPEITVAHRSLTLRKGGVYRLTGQVFPAQSGRKVQIWTNRGGAWHKLTLGGTVSLVRGSTFATRRFGTPARETYELQVRMGANAAYLAGTSALVKVTVK
jgi:photosystem II stability/assembly factor-like uncharacterized protein